MDKEILKLKIQSLISLRTSIINTLIILVGGTVSLGFLPDSLLRSCLILLGVFYTMVVILNLDSVMGKIDKLLNQEGCKNG